MQQDRTETTERGGGGAWLPWVLAATIVTFVVMAYRPVLGHGFLNWDDDRNFVLNEAYRGLGGEELAWAWRTYHLGVWQPLAWVLFGLQHAIGGMQPGVYNAVSLAWHVAVALLVYALAVRLIRVSSRDDLTGRRVTVHLAAAGAALLFAVHPLRVEAVAWVSCQPYLPAAFFFFLGVFVYVGGHSDRPGRSLRAVALALVCYVVAVGFKAVAISLPVVLLICDVYPLRRLGGRADWATPSARRALVEKIPFVFVAVFVAIWAAEAKDASQSRMPLAALDVSERVAQGAYGLVFYLARTIVPTDLHAYYRLPADMQLATPRYMVMAAAVVVVGVLLVLFRRRVPAVVAAVAAYGVILLPNLGLVQISQQAAADRYSYLATVPLVLLLAGGLYAAWRRLERPAVVAATMLVVAVAGGVLATAAQRQTAIWRTSEALWAATIAADPECAVAECNLGHALVMKGRFAEASGHLSRAIDLRPDFAFAWGNLAAILLEAGRYDEAVLCGERALELGPDLADGDRARIHALLGEAYAALRKDEPAWRHTRAAQRLGFEEAARMVEYLRRFSEEPREDASNP